MMSLPDVEKNPGLAAARRLSGRYGYSAESATAADDRVCEILGLLSDQLARQKSAGSEFLVGPRLSAVDIYWATFAAMVRPLPPELCPMSDMMRGAYGGLTSKIEAALDEDLITHRDRIYQTYLELPMVF